MKTAQKKTSRYNWRPFEEARIYVRTLGLKNRSEWDKWAKSDSRPVDIPRVPDHVYRSQGWVNWGDWLGTGRIANQNISYRPFQEAREFVRGLGLQNQSKWQEWSKTEARPNDIP